MTDDWRDLAVEARDRTADGRFFFGVVTTGIYCRPSCPARTALRDNRRYFASTGQAERAGFRACLKCRPRDLLADPIARACRFLETAEGVPSLHELAAVAGLSPHHFHRRFKAETGVTPRAFAAALRAGKLAASLGKGQSVTDAIHGAGYESARSAYAESAARLGMQPSRVGKKGAGSRIQATVAITSLGALLVAATDLGLVRIAFGQEAELMAQLAEDYSAAEILTGDDRFATTVATVVAMVEEAKPAPNLPLDIRGTAFQQQVWEALRRIPAGETATYGEIAAWIGKPKAVRAVASACAANEIALAIPCHRVVPAAGGAGGYRWGEARKEILLRREGLL